MFVALSCLQGRPSVAAFDELAALGAGIQLTPGNLPDPMLRAHVTASATPIRRHHGFAFDARVAAVWSEGACVTDAESVHPPKAGEPWRAWLECAAAPPIVEVMYPGYELGTGAEVERAIDDGLVLAVDISHVFIQLTAGAMDGATWRRLQAYDRIAEVHVSANRGRADAHQPIAAGTFGLAWARERGAHAPTILECYMHRLSDAQRRAQLAILTGSV
jgi:hypothetical protein